jgi:hypothetical protein
VFASSARGFGGFGVTMVRSVRFRTIVIGGPSRWKSLGSHGTNRVRPAKVPDAALLWLCQRQ